MVVHVLRIRGRTPRDPTARRGFTRTLPACASCFLCLILACGGEYNPFADQDNAGLHIAYRSIDDGDTVTVFSAETLSLIVTVKEKVSSFTVTIPGNRLWTREDTVVDHSRFNREPFDLIFSMHDTGTHDIVLGVTRRGGTRVNDTISLYAAFPSVQPDIDAYLGDSITLRCAPAGDRDVAYHWSLGTATEHVSRRCSLRVAAGSPVLRGSGAVWIGDGETVSPADSFSFTFHDSTRPEIVCLNEHYRGGDTVYTGDSLFNFRVRITDRGEYWVDSASVNGLPFDRADRKVYTRLFDNMHLHPPSSPLRLDVYALDHYDGGNRRRRTYRAVFIDTLQPSSPADIVVEAPSRDSLPVDTRRYAIRGRVENNTLDSVCLALSAFVNGREQSRRDTITEDGAAWQWTVELDSGPNTVVVTGADVRFGGTVDRVSRTIIRVPSIADTIPPIIARITAGGRDADGYYSPTSRVTLGVRAYDEGGRVDTLTINDSTVAPSGTDSLQYFAILSLVHHPAGNEILVRAVDDEGNGATATSVVYVNRLPYVVYRPEAAFLNVGTPYLDSIGAVDPDGDTVTFDIRSGPDGPAVDSAGMLSWTPASADTGRHEISVRIWDGYQPRFITCTLYVSPAGHLPPGPVRFATRSEDFPPYLEVGGDSLHIPLSTAPGTGMAPFHYTARLVDKDTVLPATGEGNVVTWEPDTGDTGFHHLRITVTDRFPSSDTLYPRILVVPPNRPCSISTRSSGPLLADGTVDLNAGRKADTLVFRINDPDHPMTEVYDIVIYHSSRSNVMSTIDSAVVDSFTLAVDPRLMNGYDTVTVVVTDRGGHRDTLVQPLYYGMPPYAPQVLAPENYAGVSGTTVTLSWQTIDPDADSLSYDLYLGDSPQTLERIVTTRETGHQVTGLDAPRSYYWKVVARDWKSYTEGPLWVFSTQEH